MNLNADLIRKIFEKKLYPTAKKWFGEDTNDWYLQEDNDPKHTSKKCNSWREANQVQRLPWPSSSPDLNLIENVRAFIKSQIRGKLFSSTSAMERKLRKIWKNLSDEYAENLVNSMSNRLQAVVDNDGDRTLY